MVVTIGSTTALGLCGSWKTSCSTPSRWRAKRGTADMHSESMTCRELVGYRRIGRLSAGAVNPPVKIVSAIDDAATCTDIARNSVTSAA